MHLYCAITAAPITAAASFSSYFGRKKFYRCMHLYSDILQVPCATCLGRYKWKMYICLKMKQVFGNGFLEKVFLASYSKILVRAMGSWELLLLLLQEFSRSVVSAGIVLLDHLIILEAYLFLYINVFSYADWFSSIWWWNVVPGIHQGLTTCLGLNWDFLCFLSLPFMVSQLFSIRIWLVLIYIVARCLSLLNQWCKSE